ncbi:MAG TPA: hypothetical protein VGF25_20170 [Thermoleophilaceae bacterium]
MARGTAAFLIGGAILSGCGEEDFANKPRPPVTVDLTGVVQTDKVTVSPSKLGAGPVRITISNQTKQAHTITLEGDTGSQRVGPVEPLGTATLRRTLAPGIYQVKAGTAVATPREIAPAELTIGRERPNSNDKLLLP